VVSQSGTIVLLNAQAERQFGYFREELVGQPVIVIIPAGIPASVFMEVQPSSRVAPFPVGMGVGLTTGIELEGRRRDGSVFPIEIMLSPMRSLEGLIVTAAIRDITTRKNAEASLLRKMDELHRSNEELEQFAYIASHDLQEPLRMVASYTQLLSKRYKGKLDSDADDFIAFAVDGATRMQRMIQDLLSYSRIGKNEAALLDTSSGEALHGALLNLEQAIRESGALVTNDVLPNVLADRTQLTQVFQNLVGNAIKYRSLATPCVHVSASQDSGGRWIFAVADNGIGIDPQYFERIFGMFQRLHSREEFAGTGIGLSICKKIVERQGGRIWVQSRSSGGSLFLFTLDRGVDAS